jgi:transposase
MWHGSCHECVAGSPGGTGADGSLVVSPHRMEVQAQALLALADGASLRSTAKLFRTYPNTVAAGRDRFVAAGVAGVGVIAAGRGRKPVIPAATIEAIVHDTLHTVPADGSTCWTTRSLGDRHGVSKDTVAGVWKARNLRPWQVDTFKLSNDADFEAKLVGVVGLYLDPPERAVVFSFDEKTQCQALDRTQPSLPIKPGRGRTMAHDYKRNGTVDLFAAMNLATGEVLHDTRRRHAGDDVLAFFKLIDLHVPGELDVHVVFDNLSAHKSQPVRRWLADPKRQRWHLHFTPTSASWLNLIEGWFSIHTRKALTSTSFTSTTQLEEAISRWTSHWNTDPQPFVWTKTVNDIITKVKRGRATLDRVTESATDH